MSSGPLVGAMAGSTRPELFSSKVVFSELESEFVLRAAPARRIAAVPVSSHVQRQDTLPDTSPATRPAPSSVPALNKAWKRTIEPAEPPSPTVAAEFIAMSTRPAEADRESERGQECSLPRDK